MREASSFQTSYHTAVVLLSLGDKTRVWDAEGELLSLRRGQRERLRKGEANVYLYEVK